MQNYELTYLITPSLDEKTAQDLQEKVNKILAGITTAGVFKKIKLAYPIDKLIEAFLVSVEFNQEPAKIPEIDKEIGKIPEIIRYLLIKKEIPKPMKEKKPRKQMTEESEEEDKKLKTKKEEKADMETIEKDLDKILED